MQGMLYKIPFIILFLIDSIVLYHVQHDVLKCMYPVEWSNLSNSQMFYLNDNTVVIFMIREHKVHSLYIFRYYSFSSLTIVRHFSVQLIT